MKVLIINDEPFIIEMIVEQLKQINLVHIDTALNGYDGFNMVT